MDTRGIDEPAQIRELIDRVLLEMCTAIPAVVDAFYPETQTADVIPAIQYRTYIDNVKGTITLPKIINVPIVVTGATSAGFVLTYPIEPEDDCLLIFSQRAIDNWHELGGIQPPESGGIACRHHHLTDAIAIVGIRSLVDVVPDWRMDGIELRNSAGDHRCTIRDDNVEITTPAGKLIINTQGDMLLINNFSRLSMDKNGEIDLHNGAGLITISTKGDVRARNAIGRIDVTNRGAINLQNGSGQMAIDPSGTCTFTGPSFVINAPITLNGLINISGALTVNGLLVANAGISETSGTILNANAVNLTNHIHSGVTSGPDKTAIEEN